MNISVELTLTPLQDDFEPAIINFIKSLRASGLKVLENPLSTQVYGEYDEVMGILQKEMKIANVALGEFFLILISPFLAILTSSLPVVFFTTNLFSFLL